MCISMELVTAVLGDHGQRPKEDFGKTILVHLSFGFVSERNNEILMSHLI